MVYVVWDYSSFKVKGKEYKQKTSPKKNTELKSNFSPVLG